MSFNMKHGCKNTNKRNMKKIVIEHGTRKELMKIFNTTYPTIRGALNYKTDSLLSSKIRQAALNRGGIVVESKR